MCNVDRFRHVFKGQATEYAHNWHVISWMEPFHWIPGRRCFGAGGHTGFPSVSMQQAGQIIGPFAAGEVGLVGSCLPEMAQWAQQRWVILVSIRHGVLRCSPHLRTGERGGAAGKIRVNRGCTWRTHITVGRVLDVATDVILISAPGTSEASIPPS